MDEEDHQVVERAFAVPERLGDLFGRFFGAANGVDLELPRREPHEPVVICNEECGIEVVDPFGTAEVEP
jgi:hypothetical protein